MNEMDLIRKLSAAAQREEPPPVDVVDGVLSEIRGAGPAGNGVLWVGAAVSSLAATVVGVAAARMLMAHMDPLHDLFTPLMTVMQ